jgi:hypothetical protein
MGVVEVKYPNDSHLPVIWGRVGVDFVANVLYNRASYVSIFYED